MCVEFRGVRSRGVAQLRWRGLAQGIHGHASLHFNQGRPQYRCYGGVHPLLKNHGNIVPVRAEVKSMLGGHAPEPTDKAGLLPFNNGMVYDFTEGKALKVHRGIAPSRSVPWPYQSWQIDGGVQKEFKAVVDDMLAWELGGGGDMVPEPATGDVEQDLLRHTGKPELAKRFVSVLEKIPGAGFLTAWFDADGISYFLQHYVRMLSAAPKFTEMLNFHGPPRSGKDAVAALFETHVGNIDEGGFCGGLMPEQVQIPQRAGATTQSRNGPTPFTDALKGARGIVVPELKQDEALDMEMLKALVEQEGARITSRKCRGNTSRWRPTALIVTIGNYCPNFGAKPPDGTERRVNVLTMTNRFAVKPDPDMMVLQGDFTLKGRINKGLVWNDFFHVARAFFCFLEHYGDKIRRPRKVEQDTAEALQTEEGMTTNAEGERKVKLWYNDVFRPASTLARPSTSPRLATPR